jgi:hypothetical protein
MLDCDWSSDVCSSDLVLPLAASLLRAGRRADAAACLGVSAAVVGAFGVWSLAKGGLPVPNSLLMKAGLVSDYSRRLRDNLGEGAPLVLLAASALALADGPRETRRATWLALAVTGQILLAGIGWLYRYEGWLMTLGLGLVVPQLRAGAVARGRRLLLGVLVLGPGAWRAWQAWTCFVPAAVAIQAGDGALARMVAAHFPTARVAVHDVGYLAWSTDAPIFDLAGLGTTEVTRLHVRHRLDGAALDALVRARGVDLAWTDERWLAADVPASFQSVGTISFPVFGGATATARVWVTRDELLAPVAAALGALPADEPRTSARVRADHAIPLGLLELEGPAVVREGSEVALYSAGTVRFRAPESGRLSLTARGTEADGRGPTLRLSIAGVEASSTPIATPTRINAGRVVEGDLVELRFADDLADAAGGDRNLWLSDLHILEEPG